MDNHRAKFSKANDQKKKKRNDELMFGFRFEAERIKISLNPKTVVVPISTRAVGFMSQFLFCTFAQLNIYMPTRVSVYKLFRVTLLQIEARLKEAFHQPISYLLFDTCLYKRVTLEQMEAVGGFGANLAPVANMLRALGVVNDFGTRYFPGIVADEHHHGNRIPEPTTVTFSTLQWVVTVLSDGNTPFPVRDYFYKHSALPGAIWIGSREPEFEDVPQNERFPILGNPLAFWPEGYEMNHLIDDIQCVKSLIEAVGRKYPNYVHRGRIDRQTEGHASILVSNDVDTLRCNDLAYDEQIGNGPLDDSEINYKNQERPIVGNLSKFWSPEKLSDSEFFVGVFHLFGELPQESVRTKAHSLRTSECGKQEANINYVPVVMSLLG